MEEGAAADSSQPAPLGPSAPVGAAEVVDIGHSWHAEAFSWHHGCRGVLAGFLMVEEKKEGKEKEQPNSCKSMPDIQAICSTLGAQHPEWSFLRTVLPSGLSAAGAGAVPVHMFAANAGALDGASTAAEDHKVTVRPARTETPHDRMRWEPLFLGFRFSQIPSGAKHVLPDVEAAAATWKAFTTDPCSSILLAMSPEEELLGVLHMTTMPCSRPWSFISDLFVSPSARRRGLGLALVRAALAWSVERGLEEVRWFCLIDNPPAMALYTKAGFTPRDWVAWQYD